MKIALLGLGEAGSRFANDLVGLGVQVSGNPRVCAAGAPVLTDTYA